MAKEKNALSIFSFKRVLVPILLGLGVAVLMVMNDFSKPIIKDTEMGKGEYYWQDTNNNKAKDIEELFPATQENLGSYDIVYPTNVLEGIFMNWSWGSTFCILAAVFFVLMRDLMYMYRIRLLCDKRLSWKQSFHVIMLWEFGSAVTPSVVGGSALAFFIVSLEGIPAGRSTAIVMITAMLDELFYIIITPLVILAVGANLAFIDTFDFNFLGSTFGMTTIFAIGYGFMCLLTIFILVAIFFFPQYFSRLLSYMGSRKLFKRWQSNFEKMGSDIMISSKEFKGKSIWFWAKAYFCTVFSWTSRFLVVNCLILAFTPYADHILVFARQLVMWIILCISPTPGSSGIAEFAFPIFFEEFLPLGTASTLSVLWRIFTYYPYIIVGLIVLPIWSKRVFRKKNT